MHSEKTPASRGETLQSRLGSELFETPQDIFNKMYPISAKDIQHRIAGVPRFDLQTMLCTARGCRCDAASIADCSSCSFSCVHRKAILQVALPLTFVLLMPFSATLLLCAGASPSSVVDGSSIIDGGSPSTSPPTMTSPVDRLSCAVTAAPSASSSISACLTTCSSSSPR